MASPRRDDFRLETGSPSENADGGPSGDRKLILAGDYLELDPSVTLAASGDSGDSVAFEFVASDGNGNALDIDGGECSVISAIINGERRTFFITPEEN